MISQTAPFQYLIGISKADAQEILREKEKTDIAKAFFDKYLDDLHYKQIDIEDEDEYFCAYVSSSSEKEQLKEQLKERLTKKGLKNKTSLLIEPVPLPYENSGSEPGEKLPTDPTIPILSLLTGMLLLALEKFALLSPVFTMLFGPTIGMPILAACVFLLAAYVGQEQIKNAYLEFKLNGWPGFNALVVFIALCSWSASLFILLNPQIFIAIGMLPFFSSPLITLGFITLSGRSYNRQRNKLIEQSCDVSNKRAYTLMSNHVEVCIDGEGKWQRVDLNNVIRAKVKDEKGHRAKPKYIATSKQIKHQSILRIPPGQCLPVNGRIIADPSGKGEPTTSPWKIDLSAETGESKPCDKKIGDFIISGARNASNKDLFIKFDKSLPDNGDTPDLFQRIQDIKDQSFKQTNPKEQFAGMSGKAALFTLTLLLFTAASACLWFFLGPVPLMAHMVIACISVLMCACPFTLSMMNYMPTVIGMMQITSKKMNVVPSSESSLDRLSKVDVWIFDKTGTLTGNTSMQNLVFYKEKSADQEKQLILQLAALQQSSTHPCAKAYMNDYQRYLKGEIHSHLPSFEKAQEEEGAQPRVGVIGKFGDEIVEIVSAKELRNSKIAFKEIPKPGSVSYVLVNKKEVVGHMWFKSTARPEAKDCIKSLKELKGKSHKVYMLTGDNEAAAKALAKDVGIEEVNINANQSAKDKATFISKLQKEGHKVAFFGDGANDLQASEAAFLSGSITQATDIAGKTSLMLDGNLAKIPLLVDIANAVKNAADSNTMVLYAVHVCVLMLAGGGLFFLFGLLLPPSQALMLASLPTLIPLIYTAITTYYLNKSIQNKVDVLDTGSELKIPSSGASLTSAFSLPPRQPSPPRNTFRELNSSSLTAMPRFDSTDSSLSAAPA